MAISSLARNAGLSASAVFPASRCPAMLSPVLEARLRAYDGAMYSYTVEGMTILEGVDPDLFRVIVAYPTPRQLPRAAIVERLRG